MDDVDSSNESGIEDTAPQKNKKSKKKRKAEDESDDELLPIEKAAKKLKAAKKIEEYVI